MKYLEESLLLVFFENIISNEKLIDFLNSIWELKLLPSTDSRFKDLEGDIIKHIILNDDWDFNTLFLEKLSLLDDDNKFQQFIEQIANPPFNGQEQDAKELISIINDSLNKERLELAICNYSDDGLPIYAVTYLAGSSISTDFPINIIPFFVEKNPTGNTNKFSSHTKPNQYPAFVLVADYWDDFGVRSYFDLFYYSDSDNRIHIGAVKIIHITELSRLEVDEKGYKTKDYIPDKFEILSDNFCSLGQMQEYYDNIKSLFPQNYKSILWAVQDCAIFSEIEDNFSKHKQFYSLIRENKAEQLLRQEKYIIEGQNVKSRYQFSYQFAPKYSEDIVTIDFKFDKEGILPNRIYAIIGENGVGKTQFITTLPLDIANKESNNFTPHIPIFSKIIAVSNSYYDNFKIPKRTASFNYVYCGISKLAKKEKEILTPSDLRQRLQKAFKEIQKQERVQSLKNILDNILDEDIIEKLFKIEINEDGEKLIFQYKNITSICDKISSGQSTLMYVFSDIVSNIRYDSLLLFDEPETHLHPNAITTLMTAIYELLEEYQSYSIISTHSPLIVRELLSRSVYIMERSGNYPSIKKIGLESFGENLTVLTEEIFGNKEVPKYYKRVINELILKGLKFEEITSQLKTEGIPLSLNVTMYIKSLIEACNEKINSYKGNSFEFHIEVVKSKHKKNTDPTYKDRIENLEDTIQRQFQEYDRQFNLDNLPILSPEALSPQEQADLKLLYKYDTKPFQKLNDILTTGENNTRQPLCPFCTINNVNTLDHLIPKTEFAEFSDHPVNLMPCCSDCNSKKSSNWRVGNERKYLNLYLDELPKIQYLFVSLSIVDSTIKAKFTVENRNHIEVTLFQKIINHYEDLELCKRFSLNCDNTISELKNLLKQIKIHVAKEKIIESVEKAEDENRNYYGYNYWKSLLIIECCKNHDILDFLLI